MPINGTSKDIQVLTHDRNKAGLVWSADEQWIYYTAQSNGGQPLYRINISSKKLVEKLDAFLGFPKFDPHGDYVRTWVPELATLGDAWIHTPWNAPESIRRKLEYPEPVVDLTYGRQRFLAVAKSHLRKSDAS